jgi:hypothetical protein
MFHQVLRFKMGACVIFGTGGMNDRQSAIVISRREILQEGVQSKKAIERHGVRFVNGDAWPGAVVAIVLQWRNHVQAVSATTQENDYEGVALVAVAGGVCLK